MKKSKRKFVLAGLFLLAAIITGLTLTGCETEVDTDSPRQEQPNTVTVEAADPVNPSAGTITKSESGYTFTAGFGDNVYTWFVDGEVQQGQTGKEFIWDTSGVAAGVHEIRVEVADNDARISVEVRK